MSEDFKIESGIQIVRPGKWRKYPFNEMKPGDSFLLNGSGNRNLIAGAASAFGKVHGQKFSVRKTAEGYRCWRVS